MDKKRVIMTSIVFLFLIFAINFIQSQETSYCCERLDNEGPWCQSVVDETECDADYRSLATSCDQTSFCTLGTCVNEREGTCEEGVPQQVCTDEEDGFWVNKPKEEVSQCQVGCCLYGDTAFLGTATQCTYQSTFSGLQAEFDPTITDEFECISNVLDDEEGACIYETDVGTRTCQRLSKSECDLLSGEGIVEGSVNFEVGKLCSAPELATICGPAKRTIVEDYDVYYVDSCGNKANIYDADRYEENIYWSQIERGAECDDGQGNKNSRTCGQCEYFAGSIGKNYRDAGASKPVDGEYICASLDCGGYDTNGDGNIDSNEENYKHGESWCASYSGLSEIDIEDSEFSSSGDKTQENIPGSRYVQLECRNGEVIETACEGFRNTVCAEDYVDLNDNGREDPSDFKAAECVANRWQDCILQKEKDSCENQNFRDCQWIVGTSKLTEDGEFYAFDDVDNDGERDSNEKPASCVPKFSPGFDFWEQTSDSTDACAIANTQCVAKYEVSWIRNRDKVLGDADIEERISYCVENCYCIPGYEDGMARNKYERDKPAWHPDSHSEWIESQSLMCLSLGDCGTKLNYVGELGEERDDVLDTGNFVKKAK